MQAVLLSGGVGGARFAYGLQHWLQDRLTIIVNVGDDFEHFGLYICPDADTVLYTLSGKVDETQGWGQKNDTWNAMEQIQALGGPTWFRLGDRDIGLHMERTRHLREGWPLHRIHHLFAQTFGLKARLLPATNDSVPTIVHTDIGDLPLQAYLVKHKAQPKVQGFTYLHAAQAKPAPGVLEALEQADVVFIAPSNVYISIQPILALPGIRDVLSRKTVVAVSPIIQGKAVKGPLAKMMQDLGQDPSPLTVARAYPFLKGFIMDERDAALASAVMQACNCSVYLCNTLMKTPERRVALARSALDFARTLMS